MTSVLSSVSGNNTRHIYCTSTFSPLSPSLPLSPFKPGNPCESTTSLNQTPSLMSKNRRGFSFPYKASIKTHQDQRNLKLKGGEKDSMTTKNKSRLQEGIHGNNMFDDMYLHKNIHFIELIDKQNISTSYLRLPPLICSQVKEATCPEEKPRHYSACHSTCTCSISWLS